MSNAAANTSTTIKTTRGSRRKSELIAATRRAILKHGMAVQLIQIAAEAEVAAGTILYHYPDVSDLVETAYIDVLNRFTQTRIESVRDVSNPICRLHMTLAGGLPSSPQDTEVVLLAQLSATAASKPEYSELLNDFFDQQVVMYQEIVEALGHTNDQLLIAQNLVLLEDGMGYRVLADHPLFTPDRAYRHLLSAAATLCGPLHCPHINIDPHRPQNLEN